MKSKFWWMAAAVLTLALAGQLAYMGFSQRTPESKAVWAFQPKSFAEVTSKAQVIAEAEVVSVAKGADIVNAVPAEPNGVDVIPTQRITVRVVNALKGAKVGETFTVFRTGGETVLPPAESVGKGSPNADPMGTKNKVLLLDDDPAYTVGERYFLLMEAGPDGTLRPVSPEGRYHITGSGTLTPVSGSEVAQSVSGRTVNGAMQMAGASRSK